MDADDSGLNNEGQKRALADAIARYRTDLDPCTQVRSTTPRERSGVASNGANRSLCTRRTSKEG